MGANQIAGYQLLKSGLIPNINKDEGSSTSQEMEDYYFFNRLFIHSLKAVTDL